MTQAITQKNEAEMIAAARAAQKNAYSPYSGYPVGAAVLGSDGQIYSGANIENASFGATVCAERSALFGMVNAGCKTYVALAFVTNERGDAAPCMLCRQVMTEFCAAPDVPVYFGAADGTVYTHTLRELAPLPFISFAPDGE